MHVQTMQTLNSILFILISIAPTYGNPGGCLSNTNTLIGWYDADSVSGSTWYDLSGHGNHGSFSGWGYGVFSGNNPSHELYLNGESVVYGNTASRVTFGATISGAHTVFNVCKYRNYGSEGRIIQSEYSNMLYGFWWGRAGIDCF